MASFVDPCVSDVRVADGEMCAIPAANSAFEADAAAPDVAGGCGCAIGQRVQRKRQVPG